MVAVLTGQDERLLIGGEWVDASLRARFDVTNPATGQLVGSAPDASEADVVAAIDAAAGAFDA
jgi:succinate-semialdehyde dehydrogenase / glutarate-semialdehyde dehydrogenase